MSGTVDSQTDRSAVYSLRLLNRVLSKHELWPHTMGSRTDVVLLLKVVDEWRHLAPRIPATPVAPKPEVTCGRQRQTCAQAGAYRDSSRAERMPVTLTRGFGPDLS